MSTRNRRFRTTPEYGKPHVITVKRRATRFRSLKTSKNANPIGTGTVADTSQRFSVNRDAPTRYESISIRPRRRVRVEPFNRKTVANVRFRVQLADAS